MSDSHDSIAFLAPEASELAPLFPGYEIEGLIATGGMGAVYCAVQKSLDRTVAIKILPQEFSNDAAFCAGFEAEAKAMARLNHPNLIGVYDFGEVNGMLYIIMEYVPGQSLFHSSHGQAIDPGEVIRLVTGICNGLAHAHQHGIVHRDIKPSNILLDLNAQPKIGDFGLARPVERQVEDGEEIFGTPHYTAPEVVTPPHAVDWRADIFSVGVMLHELLTGRLPAEDPRPASVIIRCDPRFDAIIRRATDPLPDRRYSNAQEISNELQAIAMTTGSRALRANPVAAPPRPQSGRIIRGTKKKKAANIPGFVMLLLAVAIGIYSFNRFSSKKPTEQIVVTAEPEKTKEKPVEPDEKPEQKPEPQANHDVAPSPEPTSESDTSPAPEPSPLAEPDTASENAVSAEPKYDVSGFFARARKIMHDRAAPQLAAYQKDIDDNFFDFERNLKRLTRKIEIPSMRARTEKELETIIPVWRKNDGRVPEKMGNQLTYILDLDIVHAEALEKQAAIDEKLQQSLGQLGSTYILGLEKQIERLKADNDPAAIDLIEDEIKQTREDEKYFPTLMRDYDGSDGN